jgi:prophage tail gpP-like protein
VSEATRLRSLERLAALYEILAYTDGLALDHTRAALREVDGLLEQQSGLARSIASFGRDALLRGDTLESLLRESQVELALWNRSGLELLRGRSKELQEQAAERYRKSLLEESQADTLTAQAQAAAQQRIERRQQAEADDRYLSRMRWLAQRAARRVKTP